MYPPAAIVSPSIISRIEVHNEEGAYYELSVGIRGHKIPIEIKSNYLEGRYYLAMHPDKRVFPLFIDPTSNELHCIEIFTRVDNNYKKSVR
jgi:hypothetical protein